MIRCYCCGEELDDSVRICHRCGGRQSSPSKKPVMGIRQKKEITQMNLDVFVNSALQNTSAECTIRITEFHKAYDSLSEGFRKQGLSGSQITDTLWARLSSICPQCGWGISGEDLGDLWMMGSIGFDRVVVFGPGRAIRFGKGNCPNETCSSNEIVLRWESHPDDDLTPLTANQGDKEALKAYWRKSATQWWKKQARNDAICDRCNGTIPRDEGYYSEGIYGDIVCEQCVKDRLTPDRLQTLYREKSSHARDELRAARSQAADKRTNDCYLKSDITNEIQMQMAAHLDRIIRESRSSGVHARFLKNLDFLRTPDSLDYAADTIASQMQKLEGKPNSILTDWRKFSRMIVSASTISASAQEAVYLFPRGYLHFLEDLFRQCSYTEVDIPFAHWACTWPITARKVHLSVFPRYGATGDEKQVIFAAELMSEIQRAYMGVRIIS